MINYKSLQYETEKEIRVGVYARVSTEHEAQVSALENQLQYYQKKLSEHDNWILKEYYVDEGISGTQAKRRPAFLRMIADAKNGELDLIITREVSRMARNTKESLQYVEELQDAGVEIHFTEDGIWSMNSGDVFKLGIMSLLAEQESRKISDRVKAGQMISRENKILYGNGNLLGYDLVRRNNDGRNTVSNTYVINEEQAETVRMIYDLYLNENLGMKKICSRLIEEKRKNASGNVNWDITKVSRVLDNRIYAGYIGYNKSIITNPISHRRVNNSNVMEYTYVKGDFPAIIDDDIWQQVQMRRKTRTHYVDSIRKSVPVRPPADPWKPKLVCACGKSFQRYKWHKNKRSGEVTYGYQCYNVIRYRKRDFLEKNGADLEGRCNMCSIPEWKFHFMLKQILIKLLRSPARTTNRLLKLCKENYVESDVALPKQSEEEVLLKKKEKLETRKKNLLEMRLDGELDTNTYNEYTEAISQDLDEINTKLAVFSLTEKPQNHTIPKADVFDDMKNILKELSDINKEKLDMDFVLNLVDRITPHEDNTFDWYIDLTMSECDFEDKNYILYQTFRLSFEDARAYRRSSENNNFLRKNQWKNTTVNIFLCV